MFIRSISDLSETQVDMVLARAEHHRTTREEGAPARGRIIALAFLEASLRTRVGFAAAAARLGASSIEVHEPRASEVSMPESVEDTLRTLSGYADAIVTRPGRPLLVRPPGVDIPVLNAGDRGADAEHPSQALIDLRAMTRDRPLAQLSVALVGDLRMRAARSLLRLLARRPPARLIVITEPELRPGLALPPGLDTLTEYRTLQEVSDVDVLYVVGIPHGALPEVARSRLRVTEHVLGSMPAEAIVLSPLPVIDEIDRAAIDHPRVRIFEQSDEGLFVRMALLELLLGMLTHTH